MNFDPFDNHLKTEEEALSSLGESQASINARLIEIDGYVIV